MGAGFARDLNGTFSLLVVDRAMDELFLVTDRVATRRLFHAIEDGRHWVGSDVSVLPTARFGIDPVGVAWYLVNGVAHDGRTPYDGIRALRRASIHRVTPSGLESDQYWDLHFPDAGAPFDEIALREELVHGLRRAVARRVSDQPDLHLSLSGGWDSTTLAGLLADDVGFTGLRCFSYVYGDPAPGSDPFIAKNLAATLGYTHRLYQSYRNDMVAHIRTNARMGRGLAAPVDEAHAWEALERDVQGMANPVLFVGDHYLGDNALRQQRWGDHQPLGNMRQFHRLRWLAPHLPQSTYRHFLEGVATDIREITERAGPRAWGYLFFDQRLSNTLVAWRQSCPGRFMKVRWPLLDYDLLNWISRVPPDFLATCPYQTTAEKMFPRGFRVPRATHLGYYPPLLLHAREQADRLRALALERDSRLDEILPPDLGSTLVDLVVAEGAPWHRLSHTAGRGVSRIQVRLRKRLRLAATGRTVSKHRALRRYLILREALVPLEEQPRV